MSEKEISTEKLIEAITIIANTAQVNPDRCLANICDETFGFLQLPFFAQITDDKENPIKIKPNS